MNIKINKVPYWYKELKAFQDIEATIECEGCHTIEKRNKVTYKNWVGISAPLNPGYWCCGSKPCINFIIFSKFVKL